VAIEQGGRRVVVNTLDAMSAGRYVVHWEVTAQDGDVVAAEFDFAVATTTVELNGAESGTSMGFPVIALLRWLFFLSLIGLLGSVVGERLVHRVVPAATHPRSLVRPLAAVGSLAAASQLLYVAVATAGFGRAGFLLAVGAAGLAASENQLEVRLRTPDGDTATNDTKPPAFDLTAKLSGRGETVILQPCGRGCFVGPVSWTAGLEYIELRVYATGWHGGMVSLLIRWAPRISRDALTRVRKVMLAQKAFRVVESITSDTTGPTPAAQSVTIDGPEFIDSDPYAGPPDPEVVVEPRPGGHRLLTFGLPAEGIHVELEVDASYRIVHETLAAPNHLAMRTFNYPR